MGWKFYQFTHYQDYRGFIVAEEKLLGDIIEEQLKKVHADKIAAAISKVTKKPCGCTKRKEALNAMHERIRNTIKGKP